MNRPIPQDESFSAFFKRMGKSVVSFKNLHFAKLCPAALCGLLLTAPRVAADADASPGGFPTVRVDLQGQTLLQNPPFDQPFLLTGKVPQTTRRVEVRYQEFLSQVGTIGQAPANLASFDDRVATLLESELADAASARSAAELQQLYDQVAEIFIQEALNARRQATTPLLGGLTAPLKWAWDYLPPWNWENWVSAGQATALTVAAPGTLLERPASHDIAHSAFGGAVNAVAGAATYEARQKALDHLKRRLANAAGEARLMRQPLNRSSAPPLRWVRLEDTGTASPAAAAPSGKADALGQTSSPTDLALLADALPPAWNRLPTRQGSASSQQEFRVQVPALEARRLYHFTITFERQLSASETRAFARQAARQWPRDLAPSEQRQQAIHALVRRSLRQALDDGTAVVQHPGAAIARQARHIPAKAAGAELEALLADLVRQTYVRQTTTVIAATEANDYVSADLGALYAGDIDKGVGYIGVNFYLRPVNKAVPLIQRGGFLRRFSLNLGLTLQSIEDGRRTRDDLFFGKALTVGAGYRLSQYVRASAGALLLRQRDPDTFPLTNDKSLALTPYAALSFDMDLGGQLKGLGQVLSFLK